MRTTTNLFSDPVIYHTSGTIRHNRTGAAGADDDEHANAARNLRNLETQPISDPPAWTRSSGCLHRLAGFCVARTGAACSIHRAEQRSAARPPQSPHARTQLPIAIGIHPGLAATHLPNLPLPPTQTTHSNLRPRRCRTYCITLPLHQHHHHHHRECRPHDRIITATTAPLHRYSTESISHPSRILFLRPPSLKH